MAKWVSVRCSLVARDRLQALAADAQRSVPSVIEILSRATTGTLIDLLDSDALVDRGHGAARDNAGGGGAS